LPQITEAIRTDPKFVNKRAAFVNSIGALQQAYSHEQTTCEESARQSLSEH